MHKRVITALVNDNIGVLNRFSGIVSRAKTNMASITIAQTTCENISRITMVLEVEDEKTARHIINQLNNQIDVLEIRDITDESHLERELALVQIHSPIEKRHEVMAIMGPFRGQIVDVAESDIVIQVTGTIEKVEAFLELIKPYGIKRIARTGISGFTRFADSESRL